MARLGLAEVLRRGQVDDLLGLGGQRRAAVCAGGSARPGLGVSLIGQRTRGVIQSGRREATDADVALAD